MGKSSGGSKNNTQSGPSPEATKLANTQMDAVTPILQSLTSQISEALGTGTSTARIPLMQHAVEAGKKSESNSLTTANDSLTRAGIGGPFLQALMAMMRQKGDSEVSQIAPNYLQSLIDQGGKMALLQGSPAFGSNVSIGSGSGQQSGGGPSGQDIAGLASAAATIAAMMI